MTLTKSRLIPIRLLMNMIAKVPTPRLGYRVSSIARPNASVVAETDGVPVILDDTVIYTSFDGACVFCLTGLVGGG